jgi:putative Holliday junction resolvase
LSSIRQGRILALDYGRAHCGCALSDPLGTIASPLDPIDDPSSEAGLRQIVALVAEHDVRAIIVGLPVALSGEQGPQARETLAFVESLRAAAPVAVETYDERFTSALARRTPGNASEHSRAAAHLLSEYLRSSAAGAEKG